MLSIGSAQKNIPRAEFTVVHTPWHPQITHYTSLNYFQNRISIHTVTVKPLQQTLSIFWYWQELNISTVFVLGGQCRNDLSIRLTWKIYTLKCKAFSAGFSFQVSSQLASHLHHASIFSNGFSFHFQHSLNWLYCKELEVHHTHLSSLCIGTRMSE